MMTMPPMKVGMLFAVAHIMLPIKPQAAPLMKTQLEYMSTSRSEYENMAQLVTHRRPKISDTRPMMSRVIALARVYTRAIQT
jgi:hypothetical protein